jgi:hypothetical protein
METNQKTWQYNSEYSYEANMSSWIDAANFERKQYKESLESADQTKEGRKEERQEGRKESKCVFPQKSKDSSNE